MINKTKNTLLQITLNKSDLQRLNAIMEQLSALLSFELNKSQTISFLIKNYGKSPLNNETDIFKEQPQRKAAKSGIDYGAQVLALKDKLNVSYTNLGEIIGIPPTTLKKYASGKQAPKDENEEKLKASLKRYGIK